MVKNKLFFYNTCIKFSQKINNINYIFRELADFIFPNQVKHVPDVFAIGTQESYSERTEWEITIQEVLGPSHLLLHSYYLGKCIMWLAMFYSKCYLLLS